MGKETNYPIPQFLRLRVSIALALIVCLSLMLSCQNSKAQTLQWKGVWVGTWIGTGVSSCGSYTDAGVMVLTLLDITTNFVTGAGEMNGIYCCQDLDYHDAAGLFFGTITNNTIKIFSTNWPIDGPCGPLYDTITVTNFGTLMIGSIMQSESGSDFSGHVFLETAPTNTTTNTIGVPKRLPNGEFTMVFFGVVGSNYAFQSSIDLINWSSVSNLTCTNSPVIVTDTAATNLPNCFYRIVPVPFGTNCTSAPAGLVAWWPADGNAFDISGTNNGMLENGVTYAPGMVGMAFSFAGTNEEVLIPYSTVTDLSAMAGWTIEAWINPASFTNSSWPTIYSKGFWDASLGLNKGTGKLESWINNTSQLIGTTALPLGQWSHVALVYDGTNRTFYVNGVFAGTGNAPHINPDNDTSTIGNVYPNENASFNGEIDEVSLYNTALSSAEIASIYLSGSNGKCPPEQ